MLLSLTDLSTLDFKPVHNCSLAIERIVVDQRSRQYLERKCVTQVLHRDGRHGPYIAPDNLTEDAVKTSATSTEGYARIWEQHSYDTFGNSTSAKPVETFAAVSVPVMPPQKFVTASKAHDIGKWNEGIADGINPEEIEVEPPVETVPQERKRKVRVDSDDEEEADEELPPPSAVRRGARVDSDDEEEGDEDLPPPCVVRRVPRVDSDDEEEDDVGVTRPSAPTTMVEANTPDRSLQGERVPSRIQNIAPRSGYEEQKLLSPILGPLPAQTMTQPTWTNNPFSALEGVDDLDMYGSSHPAASEVRPDLGSTHSLEPDQNSREISVSPQLAANFLDAQSTIQDSPENSLNRSESHYWGLGPSLQQINVRNMSPSPPKFPNRDEFDPENYGKFHRQNDQRGVSRGSGTPGFMTWGTTPASRGMPPPPSRVISSPGRGMAAPARGGFRDTSAPPSRGALTSRGRGSQPQRWSHDLVELSATTASGETVRPPPGLEIRVNTSQVMSPSSSEFNLLDEPLENIQMASIKPGSASSEQFQEGPKSASRKKSSDMSSRSSGAGWVNTYNPPQDIAKIEDNRLAELMRVKEQQKEEKRLAKEAEAKVNKCGPPAQGFPRKPFHNGRERKQKEDEFSSRQLHSTMKQTAPKPGNKGTPGNKKITDKERQQKINEVLGDPVVTSTSSKSAPQVDKMSARKREVLKKNPGLDPAAAAMLAEKQLSSQQVDKLIEYLIPLFEASRAFRGDLKFEIQLGQVLIAISKDLVTEDLQFVSKKKWESMFSPGAGSQQPPATSFSNTLTRNGHDVDRILKIKLPRGSNGRGPTKLFDELKPGPSEIIYEFHCQSKESEEFWIVVDATGKYSVRKSISTIGSVNVHFPAYIWDARAVLHGTADFCEPDEEIAMVVASFMETVYVPAQKNLNITYRQPAENEMTVRSVTVKRTSLHSCRLMDCQDAQLQITEVKTLFHRFHLKDKKLSQFFEKDYQKMLDGDRIHYEVSLTHKSINEALKQNRKLEIGALTNEATTGKSLLKSHTFQIMLDLASHVVSKIDWAGVHNNGTLLRLMQEQSHLQARVTNTNPPGIPTAPTLTGLTSTAGGRAVRSDVPGVRMNTMAEIGIDEDNKPVFIGYGGAKIPMKPIQEEELNVSTSEVVPNDSASNIGANLNPVQQVSSAAYVRGLAALQRGPGFW
jgi:hypothetical protein